jgi:hypothetical protein
MSVLRALLPGGARRHYRDCGYQVSAPSFRPVFIAIAALARQVSAPTGRLNQQGGMFAVADFSTSTRIPVA